MQKLKAITVAIAAGATLFGVTGCTELEKMTAESPAGTSVDSGIGIDTVTNDYYKETGRAAMPVKVAEGAIKYGELDNKGRATGAYGLLTQKTRKEAIARGRQPIPVDPAGWPKKNIKVKIAKNEVDGSRNYNGYMYNRSHLLADSLGGLPTAQNLVTGTRTQNVGSVKNSGGMAYTETIARDYLDSAKAKNCPLYYAAVPNYTGKELLPRTVTVDMKNCNGDIDMHVIVANTANGYDIDYMTGAFTEK